MNGDRYVKGVLTVIAAALIYLCAVLTRWPPAQAQTALRPGDPTGPGQVVIVGWRTPPTDRVPVVAAGGPLPVSVQGGTVTVSGQVTTERTSGRADRVVLVGWEERGEVEPRSGTFRRFDLRTDGVQGLPVTTVPK